MLRANSTIRSLAIAAATAAVSAGLALAQGANPPAGSEVTPAHLAAAVDAVTHAPLTANFDGILPQLSSQVQSRLTTVRPDLHKEVASAVQDTAMKLASRRASLDDDLGRVWAKAFTLDELKQIAAFYKSPAGIKFIQLGPQVARDSLQTTKLWSDRMNDELYEKTREELKRRGVDF
jgi:hypothetical protein